MEQKNDESKNDESKNDESKNDESKNDESKNDESKNDESKNDESKNDESKNDESKNDESKNDESVVIFVNKREFHIRVDSMTGRQILTLANFDINQHDLFLVQGQDSEKIELELAISIKNGLHFNAILRSVPYG